MRDYFEIEAKIRLYDSDKGRKSFIKDGYRPHIYFGFSDPTNPHFSSDCIIKLQDRFQLNPGESALVKILVLRFDHLDELLIRNVKIKIKEGIRFVGEGIITNRIGQIHKLVIS
jgi:hypothetical protein